jgi:hypothetical protein
MISQCFQRHGNKTRLGQGVKVFPIEHKERIAMKNSFYPFFVKKSVSDLMCRLQILMEGQVCIEEGGNEVLSKGHFQATRRVAHG